MGFWKDDVLPFIIICKYIQVIYIDHLQYNNLEITWRTDVPSDDDDERSTLKLDGERSTAVVGTIFRLRGAIVALSFLDWNGILIPAEAEQWKDQSRDESGKKPVIRECRSRSQTDQRRKITI